MCIYIGPCRCKFMNSQRGFNLLEKSKMKASKATGMIAVLLACAMVLQGNAQDTSCVNRLIPCLNYLNGTRNPPESCCNPLRSVIESNPECLCTLISNQGSRRAEQAGIDINEAQQLPGRCGQHVNPLACLTNAAGSSNFAGSTMSSTLQVATMAIVSATFQSLWASI